MRRDEVTSFLCHIFQKDWELGNDVWENDETIVKICLILVYFFILFPSELYVYIHFVKEQPIGL